MQRDERSVSRTVLAAALEAIAGAALVVDRDGTVLDANRAAAPVRRNPKILRRVLARREPGWSVTRAGEGFLFVERAADARARLSIMASRWKLTRRQTEILERLVNGESNKSIGAALGISERTVGAHVAAVLEKAGVGSRAALPARVLMDAA